MMRKMFTLLFLLLCLVACKPQEQAMEKAGQMSYFSFREITSGTYNPSFEVVKEGEDIKVYINRHTRKEKVLNGKEDLLERLQNIIEKYHIRQYKKEYEPNRDIMDGVAWVLKVNYSNPSGEISSTGANSWPENGIKAFSEIKNLFIEYFNLDEKNDF